MPAALSGLKALDFTALLPGPYATMMLADLGADILRIEAPHRADLLRTMPPQRHGVSAAHAQLNRGKKSLALDLKHPKARDIIFQLIERAEYDVLIEGFRPGTMQKFGLDYATLKETFPQLIYCSLTGYGQTGPDAQKAGHDLNYLARSGTASYSGRADAGPSPLGIQIADIAGGSCHSVIALLAAMIHRMKTGEGQYCDISICDATLAMNALYGSGFLATGHNPGFATEELNGSGLYDYYRCQDGRYLAFGGLEPKFVMAFFQTIGRPELLARLQELGPTPQKIHEIKTELIAEIAQKPLSDWLDIFREVEACVEGVQTFAEVVEDPQFQQRDMILRLQDQDGREWQQFGSPFKLSKTPNQYGLPGGALGADNQQVIESELELTSGTYDQLKAEGVFG